MSWLLCAAGLDGTDTTELTDDQRERLVDVLVQHALQAFEATVTLSPEDWVNMSRVERLAAAVAGRKHLVACSVIQGGATSSDGAAIAYAEIDGGDSFEELCLERSAARARAGMNHAK